MLRFTFTRAAWLVRLLTMLCGPAAAQPLTLYATNLNDHTGLLAWNSVANVAYRIANSPALQSAWVDYPIQGAYLLAGTPHTTVVVPCDTPQSYFRVNASTTNNQPPSAAIPVSLNFSRPSTGTDPLTGAVADQNTPLLRLLKLPDWDPATGIRPYSGPYYPIGVGLSGRLYGTPNCTGQGKIYQSDDRGQGWTLLTSINIPSPTDHIAHIQTFAVAQTNLLFASTQEGALYVSANNGRSFLGNLLPSWYARIRPAAPFHDNLLVEAKYGQDPADCRLLACLYGPRFGGSELLAALFVLRSDLTLGQIAAGGWPQFQTAWKQDPFDFYAQHVAGSVLLSNHVGRVSAAPLTLSDADAPFGTNDATRPRCLRITSGTGTGQSRLLLSNTPTTVTVRTPWTVTPDATSNYQLLTARLNGQGMHLHCAAWLTKSSNGETNVLFLSFGDSVSSHIIRIPNFDSLPTTPAPDDESGSGWNYADTQVFALGQQPTTLWAPADGNLYFLARDYDGNTLATPDDVYAARGLHKDFFYSSLSPYTGVGYDAGIASGNIATLATLTEGTIGHYGIFVGDPQQPDQLFRFVRGFNPTTTSAYVGFFSVLGQAQTRTAIVLGDTFAKTEALTNTWLLQLPDLQPISTTFVGNAATNLIANADFADHNRTQPTGWSLSGNAPAATTVYQPVDAYGKAWAWKITSTNPASTTTYTLSASLKAVPPATPLCLAFVYRLPSPLNTVSTTPVTLSAMWLAQGKAIRIDSPQRVNSQSYNQWVTEHYQVLPPVNADEVRFVYRLFGFTGTVELTAPSASWQQHTAPNFPSRSADCLDYQAAAGAWSTYPNSHTEFLVLPLWPADLNPGASQTVCSLETADSCRCFVTWDYHDGFVVTLQNMLGKTVLLLKLGQLRLLTNHDPCRIALRAYQGLLTATLRAGADVLEASGVMPGFDTFNPIHIRLGGDRFNPANLGWEGYYALLHLQGIP